MRKRDRQPGRVELRLLLEACGDFRRHPVRNSQIIDSDQNGRPIVVRPDRQRFGPDPLPDPFRFRPPESEPAQPHRIIRRDIDPRRADRPHVTGGLFRCHRASRRGEN
jgi:hypothetical protein